MKRLILFFVIVFQTGMLFPQDLKNEMFSLSQIKQGLKSKRVGSFDKTGGGEDCIRDIKDGEKFTLMDVKGTGVINHIWITLSPNGEKLSRNDIVIRMYWDGNSYPSVESPLGSFFGNGWNESYKFLTEPISVSPAWGMSYVSYFAMPFSKGARIEIENQTGTSIAAFFYTIDYTEMAKLPESCGRFHAWYNHEVTRALTDGENEWGLLGPMGKNKSGKDNYLFADIKGKGHFVGVNYYINSPTTMWYGEGDEMIYIDDDSTATLKGTGTEDFFNSSFSPKEQFMHPYFGYPRVNNETGWLGHTHVYRFFIDDPVYFDKSCRFTIEHGNNNNLTLDLASVAYWYQEKASALPKSFTKEERKPQPVITPENIHLWRNAWRISKGNGTGLWGNEK